MVMPLKASLMLIPSIVFPSFSLLSVFLLTAAHIKKSGLAGAIVKSEWRATKIFLSVSHFKGEISRAFSGPRPNFE